MSALIELQERRDSLRGSLNSAIRVQAREEAESLAAELLHTIEAIVVEQGELQRPNFPDAA